MRPTARAGAPSLAGEGRRSPPLLLVRDGAPPSPVAGAPVMPRWVKAACVVLSLGAFVTAAVLSTLVSLLLG